MNLRALFLAVLLFAAFLVNPAMGITSGTAPADADRRFDAVGGFTRLEWQGINNVFGNATLVASDRVLLARHLINSNYKNKKSPDGLPSDYVVRFRRNVDGTLGDRANPASFFHVRIKSWVFLGGRGDTDDAVIGILETPVSHITPMVIDFKVKLSRNAVITLASWGPESPPQGVVVPKGRLLTGLAKLSSWSSTRWSFTTSTSATPSKVVLNDSGAPILIVNNSSVRMVGFATTTLGGVSIAQLDGGKLFPHARR